MNRDKVTRLIEAGRVRAPGLAEVERAKADGRWAAAYASPGKAVVPPDFRAALDAVPAAAESFGTLDSRNRFTMIYRVEDAKRPQTRAARIEKFVALLAEGKKLHL
nr:YdeI/OmpD-associated family protein [Streptomyces sp. SPB074]